MLHINHFSANLYRMKHGVLHEVVTNLCYPLIPAFYTWAIILTILLETNGEYSPLLHLALWC